MVARCTKRETQIELPPIDFMHDFWYDMHWPLTGFSNNIHNYLSTSELIILRAFIHSKLRKDICGSSVRIMSP